MFRLLPCTPRSGSSLALAAILAGASSAQHALPGSDRAAALGDPLSVLGIFKLNDAVEPFELTLGENDEFGAALASLGDLDGNGNLEYAFGAPGDFQNRGAMWIFSLRPDRSVALFVKYGPVERLPFVLDFGDRFGTSVTALGDLDGDGIGDIAVGAPGDDDGLVAPFTNSGAVYLLFLDSDGGVRTFVKFGRTSGGFQGLLDASDVFGTAVATAGDLDGNGVEDLLVGAPGDDDGGPNRGAVWVLLLAADHSVLARQKISQTEGGFGGLLANQGRFGSSLANLGDLGGDGTIEVAVGASSAATELWILSMAANGTVSNQVGSPVADISGALSAVRMNDIDGDGVTDLALGDAQNRPLIAVVFLNTNGTVKGSTTIGPAQFFESDFGQSLATPGDTDGDGRQELLVGIPQYSARARNAGGMLIYNLSSTGVPTGASFLIDSVTAGVPFAPRFAGSASNSDYGRAIAPLGDVDGDGFGEVAVGSPFDGDGGENTGAVWIHHLSQTSGRRVSKLSKTSANLPLLVGGTFGFSLAALSDLDGNGVIDLAVGTPGLVATGAPFFPASLTGVWIVFLSRFSTVVSTRFLSVSDLGFPAGTRVGDRVVPIGDLDGDGVIDLVVSVSNSPQTFRNPLTRVVLLNADGSVKASHAFDRTSVPGTSLDDGFGTIVADYGPLPGGGRSLLVNGGATVINRTLVYDVLWRLDLDRNSQVIGSAMSLRTLLDFASPGDLDGDGIRDLALVRRTGDNSSVIWLQLLNPDFSARQTRVFNAGRTPYALTSLGDLTGDGVPDLAGTSAFGATGSVFLTQLGGIATADFERRDDIDAALMENGRALPAVLTGRTITITTEGAHLGAAAFDSTPGGLNAFSQDRDLLVGSGKVLMLQDSLQGAQSVPGIFNQPNDDADGGLLRLTFRRLVRPLSIRLIDIDPSPEQRAIVTLFDAAGRTRTYVAPGGFTEDRVVNGGTGWRTLDLTVLTPQPGYVATATAAEMSGFDGDHVTRLEIDLGSSGAVDELVYDPYP